MWESPGLPDTETALLGNLVPLSQFSADTHRVPHDGRRRQKYPTMILEMAVGGGREVEDTGESSLGFLSKHNPPKWNLRIGQLSSEGYGSFWRVYHHFPRPSLMELIMVQSTGSSGHIIRRTLPYTQLLSS